MIDALLKVLQSAWDSYIEGSSFDDAYGGAMQFNWVATPDAKAGDLFYQE